MKFSLLVGLTLFALCIFTTNAQTSFSSSNFYVKIGTVQYPGQRFDYSATAHAQQITYPFGVVETEYFKNSDASATKFQRCQTGCTNYILPYPEPTYLPAPASGLVTGPTIDGVATKQITYTQTVVGGDVYTTTYYYNGGSIVGILQKGPSFPGDRLIVFKSYSTTNAIQIADKASYSSCSSVQCSGQLDVMLVIDSSGSISDANYIVETNFLLQLTDTFNMAANAINVGYVAFSTDVTLISSLTGDKAALQQKIKDAKQMNSETNIGGAIQLAQQQLASSSRSVNKVLLSVQIGRAHV